MWGRAIIAALVLVGCGTDDERAGDSPFGSGASASGADTDPDTDPGSSGEGDGDTSTTTAGESSTGSSAPTTTGDQPPPCDPEFSFEPAVPTTAPFFVEVTNPEPLPYISLTMMGPNVVEPMYTGVVAEDPWAWRFSVSGQVPGIYTLAFGNAESEGGPVTVHSTCQLQISG